jgi:superfamily II DNA or RNA helicase
MILRPYQIDLSNRISAEWACGMRNVCAVLPTGAGKTVVFANKLKEETGVTFAIAHRQELIFQMSMALAKVGVVHSIQASKNIVKWAVRMHLQAYGRHYYDPQASCILSGIKTLLNRQRALSNAINQAKLWVIDECQHLIKKTEWGKGVALFPETCRGLGVTATPLRADGNGLGRHTDGVFD